ncbi:MAG TPA: hypothetical protein VFR17_06680 [Mycobacterium sp.]|nr:hypothetical protein [Mycobacterium sp.]
MPWLSRSIAAVAAAVGVAGTALVAPPAHADKPGFFDYLLAHGYSGRYAGGSSAFPGNTFLYGYMACSNYRNGHSLADQLPRYWNMPEYPLIAEAAQVELCPDTLAAFPLPSPPPEAPAG